jgi:uncharacterized protein YcfL
MKKLLFALSAVALLAAGCSSQTSVSSVVPNDTPTPSSKTTMSEPSAIGESMGSKTTIGDTSDASLDASLKNVDTNLTSLDSDSTSVDASLGEQQAPN